MLRSPAVSRGGSRKATLEQHAKKLVKGVLNYHGQREAIVREYAFRLSRKLTPLVAVENDGMTYVLPTDDVFLGAETYIRGQFEIYKLQQTIGLIEAAGSSKVQGRDILDIGANIGTTSIPAIRRYGFGRAWCIEPSPSNLRLLRCNILLNELEDRVTVIPVALSDQEGTLSMGLSPFGGSDHRVMADYSEDAFGEGGWNTITVDVRRLDDVMAEHGIDVDRMALAWIDVQGHEGRALAGAKGLLSSAVPVLTEYWPYGLRANETLDAFHELVAAHYSKVLDIGGPKPVEYQASDVASIAARYPGIKFTDLLLLT